MRIGMIVRKLNVKGGTQRQMLSLARELKKRGHEVVLYTFSYDKEKCYPELLEGMRVVVAPVAREKKGFDYYRDFRFIARGQLSSIFEENRRSRFLARMMDTDLDLLNPHDQVSYKVAYYYKRLVRPIPSVWNMNDLPLYRWGYDKMRGVDSSFWRPIHRRLLYRWYDWYDARFIRAQDAIAVVDFFNRELVKKYLGLSAITVRNGPDLEHFMFQKRIPPSGKVKILTSGILLPHRRFEDAVMGVKILREEGIDASLTVIGDTDNDKKYYAKLKTFVEHLKLGESVRFLGKVSEDDLLQAYASHDVYTFQHHLQSDGLSPFEAAATGMPIVVSKTAGCHEVLTDRENALFIEPKNPEDYAMKVRELVENPKFYAQLSEAGNKFVRENFSWVTYTNAMLELFNRASGAYRG